MSFEFLDPRWLWLGLLAGPMVWLIWRRPPVIAPTRQWVATALRLGCLLLLCASASGATAVRSTDDVATVFLIDHSDSIRPEMRARQEAFVREAIHSMNAGDQAAVIVFGRDALVEFLPDERPRFSELTSIPDASATDLSAALRLAAGVFPPSTYRRVVILTDGVETLGSLEDEAVAARTAGIEIDAVELGRSTDAEVLVERVRAPERVRTDEVFDVKVTLRSRQDTKGRLVLLQNGQVVGARRVQIPGGLRPVVATIPVRAQEAGFDTFEAVLEPESDTVTQNNRGIAYTRVTGEAKVLIVSGAESRGRPLTRALRAGGIHVVTGGVGRLPTDLTGMAAYDSIILENVSATDLTRGQLNGLRAYVRDIGGGLVAVGGPDAYGPGGWWKTPLEEALPVEMTLKEKEHYPAVAVGFAIDKSGSMSGTDVRGNSKIDIAREAIIQSMDLLSERDSVAVYAFDSASQEVVPATKLSQRDLILDNVASIRAGGGTDLYPGLRDAIHAVNGTNAAIKHVLVLSDGQTAPADFDTLLREARANKITVSTVAIGSDADVYTMRRIADTGGGRSYVTPDAESVPRIFTRETILVARNYVIEEPFRPVIRTSGGVLRGLTGQSMPPLRGYVGTTKKAQATEWLATHHDDPLLATWRFGLGKSAAWTSDAEGRWATAWLPWGGYPKLWTQVVRWTLPDVTEGGLQARAEIESSGVLKVTVEAAGDGGTYQNMGDVRADVVDPDGESVSLTLRQTGPGRYIGVTRAPKIGAYLVSVTLRDGETVKARSITGAAIAYSPEYRFATADQGLLARATEETGGQLLVEAADAFRPPAVPARVPREVWPLLLWMAAGLFVLDVAVRRVAIGREELARMWAATGGRLFDRSRAGAATHVGALQQAKARSHQPPPPSTAAEEKPAYQPPEPRAGASDTVGKLRRKVEKPAAGKPAAPADGPGPPPPPLSEEPGTLAGRLLKRKQERED